MHIRAPAIVCASRPHAETAVIARVLTADHGIVAGYVAGGRGRQLRPVLIPGNVVDAELRARSDSQLPFLKLELLTSRGPWLSEPLAAAAIGWTTALTATVLPEREPYPRLYEALSGLLAAVCVAPSARGWAPALIGYEALVLRELGYGGEPSLPDGGDWPALMDAFDHAGRELAHYLVADRAPLAGRKSDVMASRSMLRDRLARIGE
jgi:DNA repair protein RecO (recombination protein O)